MIRKTYHIYQTGQIPELKGLWDGAVWGEVLPLAIDQFRPEGSHHYPGAHCKLLYDQQSIYGLFCVEDRYVQSIHTDFQDDVWKDSCVEMFIQPNEGPGYFNLEFNCCGILLASYVKNPLRVEGRLQEFVPLSSDDDRQIRRFASLNTKVEPEIQTPVTWFLEFSIPLPLLERYAGTLGKIKGQVWRANFYKCGNETSHPHWASWSPLSARNFHDPDSFGRIEFC